MLKSKEKWNLVEMFNHWIENCGPSTKRWLIGNLGLNNPKVWIGIRIVDRGICCLVETYFSFDIKKKAAAFK